MDSSRPIAAIDIGTNSVHMAIARPTKSGGLQIIDAEKVNLRLGAALDERRRLSPEAIQRTIDTLRHFKEIATSFDAYIRAVATHVLRECRNPFELISRARIELGINIEVIDGVEEARLCYLGMANSIAATQGVNIGVDIGGGSTELAIWTGEKIQFISSLKLGAVTLSRHLYEASVDGEDARKAMDRFVMLRLAPLTETARHLRIDNAVASSGTAKALALIHAQQSRRGDILDINGYELPAAGLAELTARLLELNDPKKIRERYDLDPSRAEIIQAGAVILDSITKMFRIPAWHISTFGLREGLVFDTYSRFHASETPNERDVRWDSVVDLGHRFGIDELQASEVGRLAGRTYEQLAPVLIPNIDESTAIANRMLVLSAGYLHEIGKSISYPKHHKHAAYIVSHSGMMGFTQDEKMLLGAVIRFHRKSLPNANRLDEHGLLKAHLQQVMILSACVRLASSLCRTRRGRVKDIEIVMQSASELLCRIIHTADDPPTAEYWKLIAELKPLEKCLDRRIKVELSALV